jgi:putative membrane protein
MISATMLATVAAQRYMDDDHMDGWGWGVMGFVLLLVVLLIGTLIYFAARDSGHRSARSGADPIDVLDHRFARGEIDDEEYRTRRDVLRS